MPPVLTPEQQNQYFSSQSSAANPLSPADWLAQQQSTATQPNTPAPQGGAPAVPSAQQTAPFTSGTPAQTGQEALQAAQSGNLTQPQTGTLTLPQSGSVVDLLNTAGVDASYANREQLAQQYGIQNYRGTAAQNQELSKKFLEAYNANKGQPVPQSGAEARQALQSYFQTTDTEIQQTPEQAYFDALASMNPVERSFYDQLTQLASTQQNQQSFVDLYKQEVEAQGIPGLQMELADINRIMEGTEDDIRTEIEAAGGLATESQVRALTGARNKNLLRQANYISNVLQAKNDYVDTIVSLTQADRDQVSKDLDRKLGISKMMTDVYNRSVDAARQNYRDIVQSVGWDGLAASLAENPNQMRKVEKLFGMAPGELQSLAQYQTAEEREGELRLQNLELQNQKLQADLARGPSISTQVVDVGGRKVLINSKTGEIISEIGGGVPTSSPQSLALAQSNISAIDSLYNDPGLNSAVGPTRAGRVGIVDYFSGAKSNFIASVEQLKSNLSLDNLIQAKARGATFGALSDSELQVLSAAATKIGTWAKKDKAGNVVGYAASEKDFKQELDKINNFAKLDFILKGGDPTSVGVEQLPDGTMWTQNSDGTYTQLY